MKLCECGCGQPTNPARQTIEAKGIVKGMPNRFLGGHGPVGERKTPPEPQDPNTRHIALPNDRFVIVDAADFEWLSQWKWHACHEGNKWYARGNRQKPDGTWTTVKMHRLILDAKPGVRVDHKDGNGLNNTRDNLRPATHQQNLFNRGPQANNTSGFKGVSWDKKQGEWYGRLHLKGSYKFLGYFATAEEAAHAYDEAARKYHGEFAWLNFPDGNSVKGNTITTVQILGEVQQ